MNQLPIEDLEVNRLEEIDKTCDVKKQNGGKVSDPLIMLLA
jgi:hypothetical protein